jgi:DNA-binding transcriptional LysR family regulator
MRGVQFTQLTAFVAVAEYSSFTKAAAHLGTSTPSLSQNIRLLEDQFGVRLLHRTTRSVALTEAGEALLGKLNPVIEGFHAALDVINAFRDKPAGMLRIAVHPAAATAVIAPLVAHFVAKYPEIRLDIFVESECKDIVSQRFDAGIHQKDCIPQDMIAVPIGGKCRLRTVASPSYLERSGPLSSPDGLTQHNCIKYRFADVDAGLEWKFERAGHRVEVQVRGSLEVNNLDLAFRACLDGVGIAQLPEVSVASSIAEGRLVPVLIDWSSQWTDFVLFYSSRRHVPATFRALIDCVRGQSKQLPRAYSADVGGCAPVHLGSRQGAEVVVAPH